MQSERDTDLGRSAACFVEMNTRRYPFDDLRERLSGFFGGSIAWPLVVVLVLVL